MPSKLPLPLSLRISNFNSITYSSPCRRTLTTRPTARLQKWTGSNPSDHQTNQKDTHNVQQQAVEKGKADRAEGKNGPSVATSEQASEKGETQESMKREFPKKPDGPVIGLEDERGGKSS